MDEQFTLQCLLILGSLFTAAFILRRVRKAQVQIEDTIFWLLFSAGLLLLSLFPKAAYRAARALGFQAPINLVYTGIIFVLLVRQFFMTIRISQLDSKLRSLAQRVALNEEKIERERGGRAGGAQADGGAEGTGGAANSAAAPASPGSDPEN